MEEESKNLKADAQSNVSLNFYSFDKYVDIIRMQTFWYQIKEVLARKPVTVLEVGIGSKVVSGALREIGVVLQTVDINEKLKPAYIARVQELSDGVGCKTHDVVLCARVLHHVPFGDFEKSIEQLSMVAKSAVILTLPVDELRVYLSWRITSKISKIYSVKLPQIIKKIALKFIPKDEGDIYYRRLWKINSAEECSLSSIESILCKYFDIDKSYSIPEDSSHHVFVLSCK